MLIRSILILENTNIISEQAKYVMRRPKYLKREISKY